MKQLSDIDYWKLSERLSVTNASMLATGIDPGANEALHPRNPIDGNFHIREGEATTQNFFSAKFIAVFSAIRDAILNNRLRADIAHLARPTYYDGKETAALTSEDRFPHDTLMITENANLRALTGRNGFPWGVNQKIYFVWEPDWSHTTVEAKELARWMAERDFRPPFFFPEIETEEFRDPQHPRYSPKLACAVAAWESVDHSRPTFSVKQTIVAWVTSNAVRFGMGEADGIPSAAGVEEVAKVANWETKGGANRTGREVVEPTNVEPSQPIENFDEVAMPFDEDGVPANSLGHVK